MHSLYFTNIASKNKKTVEPWGYALSYESLQLQMSTLLMLVYGYLLYL